MTQPVSDIRLALPKGRMQQGVFSLLADAGLPVSASERAYRPGLPLPGCDVKILKPQNIVEMLHAGTRDLGFAGADWVSELQADLVEVLDTGMDPVRIVAAAPAALLRDGALPPQRLVVASEYERITRSWIADAGLSAVFVRSYGATEVFPPEDADVIVDNAATGATLAANQLAVVATLMASTTRLYASRAAWDRPEKRARIDHVTLLLRSVLDARGRVMVEMNVSAADLDRLVAILPSMKEPTIAPLHHGAGFAVKVAAPRKSLPELIPLIKAHGGGDIIVSRLEQIVP